MTNDKTIICYVIGKKKNQTLVSDADREIPILGSTDNAGNLVNLFRALTVYPQVGIVWSASETDNRFYLYMALYNTVKPVLRITHDIQNS